MEHREWIHAHGFRTTSRHRCPDRVVRPARDGGAGRRERFGGSGWYVAVGAGGNWTGGLEQAGYNRDNICYPTNQCPRLPEGYRWYYDLDPDSAAVFDLAVGRSLGAVRLEVSASGIGGGIQETFTGITYYDGSPVLPARDSGYAIEVETGIDGLSTRTLAFNVYRDFSIGAAGAAPYLGIGAGLSSVELSGLYYRDAYSCVSAPCSGDRPRRRLQQPPAHRPDRYGVVRSRFTRGVGLSARRKPLLGGTERVVPRGGRHGVRGGLPGPPATRRTQSHQDQRHGPLVLGAEGQVPPGGAVVRLSDPTPKVIVELQAFASGSFQTWQRLAGSWNCRGAALTPLAATATVPGGPAPRHPR